MPTLAAPALPTAAAISRDFVQSKCDYFVDVQLWPLRTELNPEAWLSNFPPDEIDHAVHLLNGFIYFSSAITKRLFYAAFQSLSMDVASSETMRRTRAAWSSFVDSVIITRVTGETPSDTDSGFIFSRMARQALKIDEERVLPPEKAIETVLARRGGRVVFVDDFVGSGNQFRDTWRREYDLNGRKISFERVASAVSDVDWIYCPVLCTVPGRDIRSLKGHEVFRTSS
jgi:hypothetical protein